MAQAQKAQRSAVADPLKRAEPAPPAKPA